MEHTISRQEFDTIFNRYRQDFLAGLDEKILSPHPVAKSTQALTYYVNSDIGSDANDGLTEETPFASIQEAIDRLPDLNLHQHQIYVAEGTYDAFCVSGKIFLPTQDSGGDGGLIITGELWTPTLTTGSTHGVPDGGTTKQTIVDNSAEWTPHELRGYWVRIVNGDDFEYRLIRDNTATEIYMVPEGFSINPPAMTPFAILESVCEVQGSSPLGGGKYGSGVRDVVGCVKIKNFHFNGESTEMLGFYGINTTGLVLENCKASGHTYAGFYTQNCGPLRVTLKYCYATGSDDVGFSISRSSGRMNFDDCFAYDNTNDGGTFYANPYIEEFSGAADSNGGCGFMVQGSEWINGEEVCCAGNTGCGLAVDSGIGMCDLDKGTFESNGGHGISVSDWSGNLPKRAALSASGTLVCKDNTKSGDYLEWGAAANFTDLTGTGNGRYGIEFGSAALHASVRITGDTAVTGSSGDVTMDGGSTAKSYAVDFANDGDAVQNANTLAVAMRKD